MPYAEISIFVEITDETALLKAARKRAIEDGAAADDKAATLVVPDVETALRMLFDPGVSPPGVSIQDSSANITSIVG